MNTNQLPGEEGLVVERFLLSRNNRFLTSVSHSLLDPKEIRLVAYFDPIVESESQSALIIALFSLALLVMMDLSSAIFEEDSVPHLIYLAKDAAWKRPTSC